MAVSGSNFREGRQMNEWFDIEWYDPNIGWRSARLQVTKPEAEQQIRLWRDQYECRLVQVTITRTVVAG